MSIVTGVCLIYSVVEDGRLIDQVNNWLDRQGFGGLVDVAAHGGGNKHPQWVELQAGFNFFHCAEQFADFILDLDWECPENVVLILQPENGPSTVFCPKTVNIKHGPEPKPARRAG